MTLGALMMLLRSQIIAQTAKFVREAGGQAEFVLSVRQAGNPNFGFLGRTHRLHRYFRWLVRYNPQVSMTYVQTVPAHVLRSTYASQSSAFQTNLSPTCQSVSCKWTGLTARLAFLRIRWRHLRTLSRSRSQRHVTASSRAPNKVTATLTLLGGISLSS